MFIRVVTERGCPWTRAIGEEGAGVHAPLALPLDPVDLRRQIAFCVLLRDGSEAREDALTPVLLVDRAPAETIDGDPVYVCPRHATPPVVMDLPQRAGGERGGRVATTGGSETTGCPCFEDGGLKGAL